MTLVFLGVDGERIVRPAEAIMSASIQIAGDVAVVSDGVWSHGHPRIERLLQIVSDTIQIPDSVPSRDDYLAARMVELMDAKPATGCAES